MKSELNSLVPSSATIHELFDQCALEAPDAIALVHQATGNFVRLSYGDLRSRADGVATWLRSAGVGAGDRVALLFERGPDLVIAMLGILKAGAAYLPLDAASPIGRLRFMVADAGVRVCLTDVANEARVREAGARPLLISSCGPADDGNPQASGDLDAYVMYTSGSTGTPKGVVIPHRAVTRLVRGQSYARLDRTRVILQLAPVTFDASTFEIWGAILNGGTCVLAPHTGIPDLRALGEIIAAHRVTTMWLTASLFNTIVDQAPAILGSVEEVLTGGEALSVPHVRRAQEVLPAVQFINGYGPTESTTFACCFRIPRPIPSAWRSVPIGRALAGTSAQILDAELRPVPHGHTGALYLGGDGLARGYLNRPELTAERFVDGVEGRVYRTGDRARFTPEGWIEFLGRDDDQVKLRGYRIELGEVESVLGALPGIARCAAIVRDDDHGDRRLVAYYTTADCTTGLSSRKLREQLADKLPEYMIPSTFVQLDTMPLTPNGKADRAALPAPNRQRPALGAVVVAPVTPVERWLAELWAEVLCLEAVGIHDRFFELGGTSIAALRLLSRMNEEAQTALPPLVLFQAPTIGELAGVLEREYAASLPPRLINPRLSSAALASPTASRAAQRQTELLERRLRRRRAN